jgi:FAD/FMN-containing dehydrogenase
VPVSQLPSFCADLDALVKETYPGWELVLFGHVGDGNIHVNIMKPDDMTLDEFVAHTARGDAAVYSLVQRYRGSVSAEHGIGLLKTHALHYSRTREEIDLMRALKIVFDPRGILNPGKVIDARTMAVKT